MLAKTPGEKLVHKGARGSAMDVRGGRRPLGGSMTSDACREVDWRISGSAPKFVASMLSVKPAMNSSRSIS